MSTMDEVQKALVGCVPGTSGVTRTTLLRDLITSSPPTVQVTPREAFDLLHGTPLYVEHRWRSDGALDIILLLPHELGLAQERRLFRPDQSQKLLERRLTR